MKPLSTTYPRRIAAELRRAVTEWPADSRIDRIDQLTDELVAIGLARARDDVGEFEPHGRIATALWGG